MIDRHIGGGRAGRYVAVVIIVAGWLRVDVAHRSRFLQECRTAIESARSTAGCLDFHLAADPLDPGRINVFERWQDVESVERFRGSGPSDDQQAAILDAHVDQYEIESITPLT